MEGNFTSNFKTSKVNTSSTISRHSAIQGTFNKNNFEIHEQNSQSIKNMSSSSNQASCQVKTYFIEDSAHQTNSNPNFNDLNKIFIGGLKQSTTEDILKEYFSKFGQLVDSVVLRNPVTKSSRGFGFVQYSEASMVDDVMKSRPHLIDDRKLHIHRAKPRNQLKREEHYTQVNKLFIGGIDNLKLSETDLRTFFEAYGKVLDVYIPKNKENNCNKPKNFGFITFDDYDPVDKITIKGETIIINGLILNVNKAHMENKENSKLNPYRKSIPNYTLNQVNPNQCFQNSNSSQNYLSNPGNISFNNTPYQNQFAQPNNQIYGQYHLSPNQIHSPAIQDFNYVYGNRTVQAKPNSGPLRSRMQNSRNTTPYQRTNVF